jgi:RNA polymerase sigma-70 factor (ECF subfamily)
VGSSGRRRVRGSRRCDRAGPARYAEGMSGFQKPVWSRRDFCSLVATEGVVGYESEAVYRRHYREILRFVRRRSSAVEADDLAQTVFLDAAAALARSAELAPPSLALLYTIARRRLVDRTRRRVAEPAAGLLGEEAAAPSYDGPLASALREQLAALPDEQRLVVVMRLVHGLSFLEIASRVGVTEGACKMRFRRGLETLRAQLEQEGVRP